jgi:hypothetical protein
MLFAEKLAQQSITKAEFVERLRIAHNYMLTNGLSSRDSVDAFGDFKTTIERDFNAASPNLTVQQVYKQASDMTGGDGKKEVEAMISLIRTYKGIVPNEGDKLGLAMISKYMNEVAGLLPLSRQRADGLREQRDSIMAYARLDGANSVFESLPQGKTLRGVLSYAMTNPRIRNYAKQVLVNLLKDAETNENALLKNVSFQQFKSGMGLTEAQKNSTKHDTKTFEPESLSLSAALKNWFDGAPAG